MTIFREAPNLFIIIHKYRVFLHEDLSTSYCGRQRNFAIQAFLYKTPWVY